MSSSAEQRAAAAGKLPGPNGAWAVKDADAFIEDVRIALYASKIVAYAQGLDEIVAGAAEYGWDIERRCGGPDLARRLHHPGQVPQPDHRGLRRQGAEIPASLLLAPYFTDAIADGAGLLAAGRRRRRPVGHPDPRLRLGAVLLRRAALRAAARPR